MNIIARTLLLVFAVTPSLHAENFHLINSSAQPVHFVVTGANDLFGLRNGEVGSPGITTLMPGQRFAVDISLTGILYKKPQLDFFPNPQGQQQTLQIQFNIRSDKHILDMPVGAICIYDFETTGAIAVEVLDNLVLRPLPGAVIGPQQIKRAIEFEKLNQWSIQPQNNAAFCNFQAYVYPFVYEYVKAGSIFGFLKAWPMQGIFWAINMRGKESSFRALTNIALVPQETIDAASKQIGR